LARENQRATQIILSKIETIRLYNWDQVTAPTNFIPTSFVEVYDPQSATNSQGAVYRGTMSLSAFPGSSSCAASMRQLTVSVNWTTRNIPRSRSITTYIAKDGIQNYVY
jgi:hypothetical protein